MPTVHRLSQNLINQIAAGEVVERPASIIKELAENSIDAGATAIEIVIKKAGRELVAITDNGCGMTPADAALALERHATSKISSFEDLTEVATMGFRGEALPSIASVSHMRLITRAAGSDEAVEIKIEGGTTISQSPTAAAEGTTITVEHLFYNVPARRKFLKSDSTELARCVEVVRTLALANKGVAFTLKDGRRAIVEVPVHGTLKDRVAALWPRLGVGELLEVSAYEGQCALAGLISSPAHPQPTREAMHFFINNRAVDSKVFSFALRDAYGDGIGMGRYPAAFLFLTLPPSQVDVNVHPAKREVRLHDERGRQSFIARALISTLAGRPGVEPSSAITPTLPSVMAESGNGLPRFSPAPFIPTHAPFDGTHAPHNPLKLNEAPKTDEMPRPAPSLGRSQTTFNIPTTTPAHGWSFLGFAHTQFAVFATPEGVALMHIPSAQAAVAADKVAKDFKKSGAQSLLVPALLQLDGKLAETLQEHHKELSNLGFIVGHFGKNAWRLEAIPEWMSKVASGSPEGVFLTILGALAEGEASEELLTAKRLGALIAKSAAGRIQHAQAALELAGALLATANPLKTPEGKPTFWELPLGELQKKFGVK